MLHFLNFKSHIQETWKRFPLALITSFAASIIGILALHFETEEQIIYKTLMVCVLATFSFSSFAVWQESLKKKDQIGLLLLLAFLIGFGWFSIPKDIESVSGSLWAIRYVVVTVLSFLILTFVPFLQKKEENNLQLWSYNQKYWTHLIVTFFSGIILFAGLSLAVFALDKLFGIDIDEKIYMQIWILVVGVFGTTFFLSQFPRPLKEKKSLTPPFFIAFVTKFILTPLVALYFLILYAYTAKIIFTWTWPSNLVGWLIIIFLMIGVLTYVLWIPFHTAQTQKWKKALWMIQIPQIIVLFFSVGLRIQQYSWTESRYIVVVLGVWLLAMAGYFILSKAGRLKILFASLICTVLFTQFGPWGMYEVGKNAQIQRLQSYNLLDESALAEVRGNADSSQEVRSIINYLIDRHGIQVIKDLYPSIVFDDTSPRSWVFKESVFTHFDIPQYDSREYKYVSLEYEAAIDVSGYDVLLQYPLYVPGSNTETRPSWYFKKEANQVSIYSPEGEVFNIDITNYIQELEDKKDTLKERETAENLSYPFTTPEGVAGVMVFRSLSFMEEELRVSDLYILLKFPE